MHVREPPSRFAVCSPILGIAPPPWITRKGSGLRASPNRRAEARIRAWPILGPKVTEKRDPTLTSIEETQAALRESIEAAKQLAKKSDFLLQKHKRKLEQGALDAHVRKDAE